VLGVVGVQTVGAFPSVRLSTYQPSENPCLFGAATLKKLNAEGQARLQTFIKAQGGQPRAEQLCRDSIGINWLNLKDVLGGLRASGLNMRQLNSERLTYAVTQPGEKDITTLDFSSAFVKTTAGVPYILAQDLIENLKSSTKWPISISGNLNPTLRLGKAALQLGTAENPFRAATLYNLLLGNNWMGNPAFTFKSSGIQAMNMTLWPDAGRKTGARIRLAAPEGQYYAVVVVGNGSAPCQDCDSRFFLAARPVTQGQLWLGETMATDIQPTASPNSIRFRVSQGAITPPCCSRSPPAATCAT
jgi:hypothetical protein